MTIDSRSATRTATGSAGPPASDAPDGSAAELARLLLATESMAAFLDSAVRLATTSLSVPVSCALTLRDEGHPYSVSSSDALAAAVDEVQYAEGAGPCLEALQTQRLVHLPDLQADTRWPHYREVARAAGVQEVLSVPLSAAHGPAGALNVYCLTPRTLTDADVAVVQVFAEQLSTVAGLAVRWSRQVELSEQLREALSSRAVIDQAIGMVMSTRRCTPEEAFGSLRMASQRRNVKLRVVAAELVASAASSRPATATAQPSVG